MNDLSGKLSKMHLTYYTESEDAESCASPHTFSVSLRAALGPNWSGRPDNPVLPALISSQACLGTTDWSQMALARKYVSFLFYQKDRQTGMAERQLRTQYTKQYLGSSFLSSTFIQMAK